MSCKVNCSTGFVETKWGNCANCYQTKDEHFEFGAMSNYSQPLNGGVAIQIKSPPNFSDSKMSTYGLPPSSRPQNYSHFSAQKNGINVSVSSNNGKKFDRGQTPLATVRTSLGDKNGFLNCSDLGSVSVSVGSGANYGRATNYDKKNMQNMHNGQNVHNLHNVQNMQNMQNMHNLQQGRQNMSIQAKNVQNFANVQNMGQGRANVPNYLNSAPALVNNGKNGKSPVLHSQFSSSGFNNSLMSNNSSNSTNKRLLTHFSPSLNEEKKLSNNANGMSNSNSRVVVNSNSKREEEENNLESKNKTKSCLSSNKSNYGTVTVMSSGGSSSSSGFKKIGKSILKKDGNRRKLSVTFPKEVCEVIGFGGPRHLSPQSDSEESEEETPSDPLDSSPISEILERTSASVSDKELLRTTVKNTNFNSIKSNLLGYAPIIIGPITGNRGGASKPLVTIGTFESRKEPLKVMRKIGEDDEVPQIIRKIESVKVSPPVIHKTKTSPIVSKIEKNTPTALKSEKTEKTKETKNSQEPIRQIVTKDEEKINFSPHYPLTQNHIISPFKNLTIIETTPECIQNAPIAHFPIDSLENSSIFPQNSPLELKKDVENYDDSLEIDSGLDLKISNSSESDTEKSGSNSDSGNETDFVKNSRNLGHISQSESLFVSVLNNSANEKRGKLSPDSVISTTSEMSSTSTASRDSTDSLPFEEPVKNAPKRLAPLPPIINQSEDRMQFGSQSEERFKNKSQSEERRQFGSQSEESFKNKSQSEERVLNFSSQSEERMKNKSQSEERILNFSSQSEERMKNKSQSEERILNFSSQSEERMKNKSQSEESIESGSGSDEEVGVSKNNASYDFTDADLNTGESEKVPMRQHEGIEFLGIRKIDAESFLKENAPNFQKDKKEVEESPVFKPRKRVNQFFSTIGKKAGAAFRSGQSSSHSALALETGKSSSSFSPNPNNSNNFSPLQIKRSLSTDEVSRTRTQEIYATLTPTSLKSKGLMLSKLSKLELNYGKDKKSTPPASKLSSSIRKFLGFGKNEDNPEEETDKICSSPKNNPAPPPPPRLHSLEMTKSPPGGTVKPARPPPPALNKKNSQQPSFMSVFSADESPGNYSQNSDNGGFDEKTPARNNYFDSKMNGYQQSFYENKNFGRGEEFCEEWENVSNPPNKPKRKASMRVGESSDGGAWTPNYLETTYNHITSLNFETLKLIASQTPAKIRGSGYKNPKTPPRWSDFYMSDSSSIAEGRGYVFYSAYWEDTHCLLLLQESLSTGTPPLEFEPLETLATFEDVVDGHFIPWKTSDYVNTGGNGVRVYITVLPSCTVQKFPSYVSNPSISPSRKYYAFLQAMDFWGVEEMTDLIVFHSVPSPLLLKTAPSLEGSSNSSPSPAFGLVFVCPARIHSGPSSALLSYRPSRNNFEMGVRGALFNGMYLLTENDRNVLLGRIGGSTTEEMEAQLRLFFQLKLFGPQKGDLDKILRYRSEKQVTQWMDKERAFCMKDAIERTLSRNSEPISPLRKSFVEFLMMSDNCAKAVLDFIVDLYPDL